MRVNISLDEDTLIAVLKASAEASCGYTSAYDDKPLAVAMLHCCDYNTPVKELLDQVPEAFIKDEDHQLYIKQLKERVEQ
jgi:hypothetical protein